MSRRTTLALAMAVALLTTGCSSGLLPEPAPAPDELAEVKARILELQRAAAMTRVEVERLRQQVVMLESRLGGAGAPAAETRSRDEPPRPVSPPAAPPPAAAARPEVEVTDLEIVAAAPVPRSAAVPPPAPPPAAPPAAPSPAAPAEPAERSTALTAPVDEAAQAIYDRGYTLYHQGRYVDAEAGFRRFLQGYPDTSLSDNAQYWIGESRFARNDFEGALAAFREVAERYPSGNKVADSLLKAADCLRQLGDNGSARATYDEVIRRFPGSAAAAMAEERRVQLLR